MTTATLDQTQVTDHGPVAVDITTRLTLATIAMDVALSGHPCVQEARQAATDAIAEAGRYSDQCSTPSPPVASVSAGILSAAADLIRARGWTQNDWADDDDCICTLRAIHLAAGGSNQHSVDAVNLLRARIFGQTGERVHSVPFWNDRRGRTVGDVLSVLG